LFLNFLSLVELELLQQATWERFDMRGPFVIRGMIDGDEGWQVLLSYCNDGG